MRSQPDGGDGIKIFHKIVHAGAGSHHHVVLVEIYVLRYTRRQSTRGFSRWVVSSQTKTQLRRDVFALYLRRHSVSAAGKAVRARSVATHTHTHTHRQGKSLRKVLLTTEGGKTPQPNASCHVFSATSRASQLTDSSGGGGVLDVHAGLRSPTGTPARYLLHLSQNLRRRRRCCRAGRG